ncbi:MAG: TAT-variant-translocated molybdopterin oxidoreductase [Chitinophagaceae bacterium]|nr:TAT-variant-translocated molybdopterin oxidoreductase [Chitinophagaceae bacterium]
MEKKYWQSFGELNNSEAFQKSSKDEFKEDLPFDEDKGLLEAKTPRRDFLKYLGFSTAAAAVAASCEVPVKKAIPFANRPEEIIPGVANYYATTYVQDGDAISVVAKVRDGRPIKIEGNELCPITSGGTSARVQASVLDLYDGARLRFPANYTSSVKGKELTFDAADKAINEALATAGNIVLLTSTINSPSSLEVINQFLAKYPGSKQVTYDAVSYSGILLANEACYNKRAIPTYRFDAAKVIVSLGADFLATWISPIEFAKQYSKGKKINDASPEMSKHIHFESVASLTGSNADERFLHRPSETYAIAVGLLSVLQGGEVSNIKDTKLIAGIKNAAKALADKKGEALVVCGSNDVNTQIIINTINEILLAKDKTIDWSSTYNVRKGVDADFAALVEEMNTGTVGALIVIDANPVYSWLDKAKLKSGLDKVKLKISLSGKADETTQLCGYVVPSHHYLESWGDAEVKVGHYSFIQPTIYPLFKTRQWQDSLMKWSAATTDYLAFLKSFWATKLTGTNSWDKALQDGVVMNSPLAVATTFNSSATNLALAAVQNPSSGIELQLYQKIAIGAGQGTANPWLQEMPDPITRATWDNYLIVSPTMAKTLLKIDLSNNGQSDSYEVNPPKKVVSIKANGITVELPALIIPGTHPDTVGIALGYGRDKKVGKTVVDVEGNSIGANAFPFAKIVNGTVCFDINNVELKLTDKKYPVALTQTHNLYDTPHGKRTEVIKELTLAEYKHNTKVVLEEREKELAAYGGVADFREGGSIYKPFDKPGIKWGMSIDLNSCNGCGACVVACNAENNIPVVGKPEVLRFHDMHWLRIDRYYSGDKENPDVVFQPMLCQHCDNAPCENVCPVAATNHSSEGLNQMTYNRCIGTRYCANNCPYKVRRFNWADYTGSDSFQNNQDELNNAVHYMNDDLTRMVLNPDVTVRSRGVIEKCSFCVQRLQEGKLKAKVASRPLKDEDVHVACAQACPSDSIIFGNVNNPESEISKARKDSNRLFYSLEFLHVMPNINYLAKVRNKEEATKA